MDRYNIICFSNQLWDFPNWTNKRHVMSRLAAQGHNVIFVDPPINLGFVFLRQLLRGTWGLRRFLTQTYKDKDSGATIFTPVNVDPFFVTTHIFNLFQIKCMAKKLFDPNLKTILWIYHVQIRNLERYIKGLAHDVLVYDCVDNYSAFPEVKAFYRTNVFGEELIKQEKTLAKQADVVFATAPGLVDKMKKYNENTHFTPNVGDYPRFKDTLKYKDQVPEDLAAIPRPRVGMIGAMDTYKFDASLVKKAAEAYQDINFVLIGPIALKDKNSTLDDLGLGGIPNVHYLGSRPYEQKHLYLAGFDVDMIPYQLNDYTVGGCFPVKFHDSLAAGLPVVVTDLPAYAPFKDVCYIAKSADEFVTYIKQALEENSPEKVKARQAVAKQNDYSGKITKMLDLISQV
jgi:glycosyltransferase involved in cell wall biosynthesis